MKIKITAIFDVKDIEDDQITVAQAKKIKEWTEKEVLVLLGAISDRQCTVDNLNCRIGHLILSTQYFNSLAKE